MEIQKEKYPLAERLKYWRNPDEQRNLKMTARCQTESGELLPCPFCGLSDLVMAQPAVGQWRAILCNECGARGPSVKLKDEEIRSDWNARTPSVAQAPNDAIVAVMTEAYGMLGLVLTTPQAQRLANAALSASGGDVAATPRPSAFLAWAVEIFGPVAKLRSERLLRFVEEAIELAHAEGMEREVFNKVADRVYSRPVGDTPKEIGQAQACLEMFAENIGISSAAEAEREWQRVQDIPREEWGRRHSAKQALGIALSSADRA